MDVLHQPDRVAPPAGARDPSQCRANVADRASDAGLQDHRGLQEGKWLGDPGDLPRRAGGARLLRERGVRRGGSTILPAN